MYPSVMEDISKGYILDPQCNLNTIDEGDITIAMALEGTNSSLNEGATLVWRISNAW